MNAAEQKRLLADVEAFCQAIRPVEELCYVEHQFNEQVVPLAAPSTTCSAMPVPVVYGGFAVPTP